MLLLGKRDAAALSYWFSSFECHLLSSRWHGKRRRQVGGTCGVVYVEGEGSMHQNFRTKLATGLLVVLVLAASSSTSSFSRSSSSTLSKGRDRERTTAGQARRHQYSRRGGGEGG